MAHKDKKSDAETDVKETQDSDNGSNQDILILEVEEAISIPDGKHDGIIVDVQHRQQPFGYIDVFVKEKVSEATLKYGLPDKITKTTSLGKFLLDMGIKLHVGVKIDLRKHLLSKEVSFMTQNEESDKGIFARILGGTIKPLK